MPSCATIANISILIAVVALIVGYFLTRRSKRKEPLSSSVSESDRWMVLEIERKDGVEDGCLWEVHDTWELRDHSEAAR
jgi:hypothetical protein